MPVLISLRSVRRTFRTRFVEVAAVQDVSFDIYAGESVAIMGPSGSGKTTLMNMIGLLDHPTAGSIRFEGLDVVSLPDREKARLRRSKIGFVFQSYNLLPRDTALENVALPLLYAGLRARKRARRAAEVLDTVGMSHRARHFPRQLSGGEQQRIAIARALVASPTILLADEPTGALDSRTGTEIMELLQALNAKGQTVVIITHDTGVAALCRRTIVLQDGFVVGDNGMGTVPGAFRPRGVA